MNKFDVMIIGAGPAGLSCASYASRSGLKALVLESTYPGGQLLSLDKVENYPAFEAVNGMDLASKFENQATGFGAVIENQEAMDLSYKDNMFYSGSYCAPICILATGCDHRSLGCAGEKEYSGRGVSYCATCDGPFFRNKKILVVGGGDSAVQEAVYLRGLTEDLTICHRKASFRAQKSLVDQLIGSGVKTKMSLNVQQIIGDGSKVRQVLFSDGSLEDFDAVFIFVGLVPRNSLAISMNCSLDESGFVVTDDHMRTSVKSLYAIGDVRNTNFRQIVTASSDGAIAAHFAKEEADQLKGYSYN